MGDRRNKILKMVKTVIEKIALCLQVEDALSVVDEVASNLSEANIFDAP